MLWTPVPTAVGVYETVQVAAFVPLPVRLGHGLAAKVPDPVVENMTVPVGLVAPVVEVSVIVAVHEVAVPTTTEEPHVTLVLVVCEAASVTMAPRIFSGRIVPTTSVMRTHVLAGEDTLLAEQPAAVGYEIEVLGVEATT